MSVAPMIRENIDRGLQDRLNAPEEAVLFMRNQIQNIKVRLSVQCYLLFHWVCVTPLEYDTSEHHWSKIQSHLNGLWNNSNWALDVDSLHYKIMDLSNCRVESTSIEEGVCSLCLCCT